jgi:hypothetical protein
MILPKNYKTMSDEKLLVELTKTYDAETAAYLLRVVRGETTSPSPLQ